MLKSTFNFDNILTPRATTGTLQTGCRNTNHIHIIDLAQINIMTDKGGSTTDQSDGSTSEWFLFLDLDVIASEFVGTWIDRTKSTTGLIPL